MRIIPAIDVIDGKCVRLSQGDYGQKKIYHDDPVAVAKTFEDAGLEYLHLVDLDGAKAGHVTNWTVIENIANATKLKVDFGGGVKTDAELERLFKVGISQVNLGSIAVKEVDKVKNWLANFTAERIVLSADVRDGILKVSGWQQDSNLTLTEFLTLYPAARYVACTDIATDGMLAGPNVELYRNMKAKFPNLRWVASGGVSTTDDLRALNAVGVDGVILGKAIYEGKISLQELKSFSC
jgi:phosphoribosylformimino-5-aminoimidazole carboxamide ribotide isomerase